MKSLRINCSFIKFHLSFGASQARAVVLSIKQSAKCISRAIELLAFVCVIFIVALSTPSIQARIEGFSLPALWLTVPGALALPFLILGVKNIRSADTLVICSVVWLAGYSVATFTIPLERLPIVASNLLWLVTGMLLALAFQTTTKTVTALIAGCSVLAATVVVAAVVHIGRTYSADVLRAGGMLGSANDAYRIISIGLGGAILACVKLTPKAPWIALAGFLGGASVLTWSRNVWVAALFVALAGIRFYRLSWRVAGMLVLFATCGAILVSAVRSHSPAAAASTQRSDASRPAAWSAGLASGFAHPLTGAGFGQVVLTVPAYQDGVLQEVQILDARNQFIQVFAETGLVGLVVFVALFGSAIAACARAPSRNGPVLLGCWLAAAAICQCDTVFMTYGGSAPTCVFGLLLGCALKLSREQKELTPPA
jgi:O-antigen ligase